MYTLAVSDVRYLDNARRVAQSEPIICPPALDTEYLLSRWGPADFIYIDLHGRPDYPTWLFANGKKVLHVNQAYGLPGGKVVFATTCHLPETQFVEAFSQNYLIMGSGKNYGARSRLVGAPLLALWVRRFLQAGHTPGKAFLLAKSRVLLTSWRRADRDALSFELVAPLGVTKE